MLFIIIISTIIALFVLILFFLNSLKKNKNKHQKIEINFEDVDSLNVSKIVIEENDIDFLRNEFWFQYKQKQIINSFSFYNLKKTFEKDHQLKIEKLGLIEKQEDSEIDTIKLIEIVISDDFSETEISKAFFLLEKRIK